MESGSTECDKHVHIACEGRMTMTMKDAVYVFSSLLRTVISFGS